MVYKRLCGRLFGERSLAFTSMISEEVLKILESEASLRVEASEPQEVLNEIEKIFVDKIGVAKGFSSSIEGEIVNMEVEDCCFFSTEERLLREKIKPFIYPLMNAAAYVMRRNLNVKSKIDGIHVDLQSKKCTLRFQMF